MKKPDGMYSAKSYTNLTVHRSGKKDGNIELVVACGYTNDGKYGYFIIDEEQTTDPKTQKTMWIYTNQRWFVPKKNEQSYRDVLTTLKEMIGG